MSAHPDFVKRLEDIIAEQKSVTRRLMTLLHDMSMGTAISTDGNCSCNGAGVVSTRLGSAPCMCAKGLPFRNAAAVQERKREASFEAQGYSRSEAKRLAVQAGEGRDRAANERD